MRRILKPATRLLLTISSAGLLLTVTAGPAVAAGVDQQKLEKAGWVCVTPAEGAPTHCLPPSQFERVFSAAHEARAGLIMTFGPAGDFWGTEHLIHHELYNGQPCPQDEVAGGDGSYIDLEPLIGIPYFVCHHFESPVT